MAEMVMLDCSLFVTVTSRDWVWPTPTLPNFNFVGQQLNGFLAWRLVGSIAKRATALIIANLSGRRKRSCASDWGSRIALQVCREEQHTRKIPEVHSSGRPLGQQFQIGLLSAYMVDRISQAQWKSVGSSDDRRDPLGQSL